MQITLSRIGDSITGSANGKSFGVSYSDQRWDLMNLLKNKANAAQTMDELKAIMEEFAPLTQESYKDVVESKSQYLYVNPHNNKFYLKYKTDVSKEPIPQVLVDRILESVEKGIDPLPIVKCWVRFLRNPNYSATKAEAFAWYINQKYTNPNQVEKFLKEGISPEKAEEMATVFQTPITDEGLICTYKVSREITKKYTKDENVDGGVKQVERFDYDVDEVTGLKTYKTPEHVEDRLYEPAVVGQSHDSWNRLFANGTLDQADTHIIKVGCIHDLGDWKKVDCSDSRSCVKGLHCGNLDYIRCYQKDDTVTHYTFVDPMDIGAIVKDGTGALRVKAYMTYASFAGVTKSLYHSSTYAGLKDKEFEEIVMAEVRRTRDEEISAIQEAYNEKVGLIG